LAQQFEPGDWLQAPFWPGIVQVVSIQPRAGYDVVTVHSPDQRRSWSDALTPTDWEQVRRVAQAARRRVTFGGDPARFRLGIEAHRLRLAHSIDPYAALNASRIDPLPHQFEAVYGHLLARPVVRALLAHDAGAGKTIMAGMLIKELKRRQGVHRVLIVAPAGLTDQWRRELLTKFGEDFTVISREYMERERLDSLDVWRATDQAITSLDFARQKPMRQALESVEWDAVIVDEAHKLAAYVRPNGSIYKTQAYQLGEVLSRHTTHLLLTTATPHKGDPDNYRLLVSLLDPHWGEATAYAPGANPAVLRRTKEEMRQPDGTALYPERVVETLPYNLSNPEGALLEQIYKFIQKRYRKARSTNRQSAAFALLTLERRLASSPYALQESLKRIRAHTAAQSRAGGGRPATAQGQEDGDWTEWEELNEQERWEREAQAEAEAAALVDPRQLQAELRQLDDLIARAEQITRARQQEKLRELRRACDLWVGQRGQQLIIFTEFKDTLDHLAGCLDQWGYTTTQIHGRMPVKERRRAEKVFWKGEAQILVATEAAGEGINLQCCHVMVNFDIPWNPCRLEQRMGRIHRYGQAAPQVYIFNLVANNTMEGEVKKALLEKLKQMRADLGDKVFDVVGNVLWGSQLRDILERVALAEVGAVAEARQFIQSAAETAREALEAERRMAVTAQPLDIAGFRQKQATFRAHRLSPETAEKFFRQAVPFVGGALKEFSVLAADGQRRPAFEVVLPPNWARGHPSRLTVSFWPEVCSDDDTEEDAVLFIAPGHWLFEALLDRVIATCAPVLEQGAVFFDLYPQDDAPYLAWFVRSHIRDGLDRRAGDLLAAVRHHADQEQVTPLPTEVLDGFDPGNGPDVEAGVRQIEPMLNGQPEVLDQCVCRFFLPELARRRTRQQETIERDWRFLEAGLTTLAAYLSEAAMEAFIAENKEEGDRLTDQSEAARQRLAALQDQMDRAAHLLMDAPRVLGVALVLPAPAILPPARGEPEGDVAAPMRRDPAVERAAMQIVMAYEAGQGRRPRDVHEGHSWDVESDNAQGEVVRYIEVKGRGPEDANEVELTEPEWEAARRLGDQHWLYIVRIADGMLWMIQNPYAKLQPKELKRWVVRVSDVAQHAETVTLSKPS
jgi:superfamily II DNA or RNA helicase